MHGVCLTFLVSSSFGRICGFTMDKLHGIYLWVRDLGIWARLLCVVWWLMLN